MDTVIQTKGLTKKYGSTTALDQLDISVQKGEVIGYLGPNGAGKTTTIRLLLGLVKPTSGQAFIFDLDTYAAAAEIHKDIAYVPGEASLWPNLTGAETLRFLANIHGTTDTAYQKELIEKFAFDPHKKVRNYSKGNRQKIVLIAALATRAKLLIVDEPTSGLDPVMAKVFRDEIVTAKQNGQTVFLSSHMLEEVEELCDRVAVLREGQLVEIGTLEELRHLSALTVEATFKVSPPDVTNIKGVTNVSIHDNHLQCNVNGEIEPLMKAIVAAHPISLLSRKPSLEELFLALYDGETK